MESSQLTMHAHIIAKKWAHVEVLGH